MLATGNEFRHTRVVKTVGLTKASAESSVSAVSTAPASSAAHVEGQTRVAVVQLLLEEGPITATAIGKRLGLSAAGVRRHLEALIDAGQARAMRSAAWQVKGRGRPAKQYQLTAAGRGKLNHAYDDLAGAAMRQLREVGGESLVQQFARTRAETIVEGIAPLTESAPKAAVTAKAEEIAEAFTAAGFAASTREVGAGVQICQHHCPVSHVAEEFPELCQAELDVLRELLGTHVQPLATIANGDNACTTHVPLMSLPTTPRPGAQPASAEETPEGVR